MEHAYALQGVYQGNVLRRGDDDRTRQRHTLAQRQLNVPRARGHVDDEVIQVPPVGLAQQLLQGLRGHGTAPHHGLVLRHQKTYRHHLHTVGFERLHGFAIRAFGSARQAHHHGLAGTVNIGIQQAHTGTFSGQGQRQVGGGGGFADTAFARGHRDDVFHLRQQRHAGLGRMGNHFGSDLDLDRGHARHLSDHVLQLLLKRRPQAFGGVAQFHLKTDIAAFDLQVFDRFAADEVLPSEGVHHGFQRVADVLFVQGHVYSSVSVGQKVASLTISLLRILVIASGL